MNRVQAGERKGGGVLLMSMKENVLEHYPILLEVGFDDEREFPR